VLAFLTVIDLSVRADVSRADISRLSLVALVVPLWEVRVGSTPKPPYVSFTLDSADAEGCAEFLDHSPDCNLGSDLSPDCNLDSDRDRGL
jgi:hypothetical protein